MITDTLVGLFVNLLRGLILGLPAWTPDTGAYTASFYQIGTMASILNGYFPVVALAGGLALALGIRVLYAAWVIVVFVYDRFPFKAT